MKKKLFICLLAFVCFFMVACGTKVSDFSIDGDSIMSVGETQTLKVVVNPRDAKLKNEEWISTETEIATVSKGVVTAKSVGVTIIILSTKEYSCEFEITVVENIPITSIEIVGSKTVGIDGVVSLNVVFDPVNAPNKTLTWKSSNTNVATVNAEGEVTGISEGEATITATTKNNVSATFVIKVVKPSLSGVEIEEKTKQIVASYGVAPVLSTKITIKNGDEVSNVELSYDYNISGKKINKLKVINDSADGSSLYVLNGHWYADINGEKTSYEMDSYDEVDIFNRTSFDKYVTNNLPFLNDSKFFSLLSIKEMKSYTSKNDGTFVYELDIVNYDGTVLNLLGAESVTFTVVLEGGNIKSILYEANILGVIKSVEVQFLGFVCEVSLPEGFE